MRKRLLYGSAIVLLAISVALVVWQGSFNVGEFAPADPYQTFIYWAISSLNFVLMVTLGFILFRTGLKLYVERRSNREGSRIKTKLVIGALALSFMPVFFLVLFSYQVLNYNLARWFTRPAEEQLKTYSTMANTLERQVQVKAGVQAELLAAQPETHRLLSDGIARPGFLERFCREQNVFSAAILQAQDEAPIAVFGPNPAHLREDATLKLGRSPVRADGKLLGYVVLSSKVPIDVAAQRAAVAHYNAEFGQLAAQRKQARQTYLSLMALITLFVLFVATWIALFLARQISVPIAALLHAAGEVRRGNLKHRVDVSAMDELAGLVRAFNEMTRELESSSRELDARRRFTEAILESIPTGVLSIAADGSIQRMNRAVHQIFPQDLLARASRLEDLFSREDLAEIRYLLKRARRTGVASGQWELKTERQMLHLAVTVAALEEKVNSGFVLVLEDTSELLRAQKAAAWHEVARRVAHEIKNPLTPISLSAERISRQLERLEVPSDVRLRLSECAEIITRSVQSVKTLVNEFSQYARFPAAQPERTDLNRVVEEALSVFSGRLDAIAVRTDLARDLPPVCIDPEQFKRVIVNLIDNAAEAMQDSLLKQLFIATQAGAAETVELVIADTGCGMSAEQKEKLFLPYFSTKGRGTGLGLAIVYHILSDHNAQVRVEDNSPAGTRFTIEIPVLLEGEAAEPAPKPVVARL